MSQVIKILLPEIPNEVGEVFFKGHIKMTDQDCLTIFITTYSTSSKILAGKTVYKEKIIYGYHSNNNLPKNILKKFLNSFIVNKIQYPKLISLVLNGVKKKIEDCIVMLYDYNKMKNSETLSTNDCCFSTLQGLIQGECGQSYYRTSENKPRLQSLSWFESSMFGQHVYNYVILIKWLLNTVKSKRKVTIEHGNLIMVIILDILLGYLVLELLVFDRKALGTLLFGILEKLVNLMYSLLKWLMGAPAGLKLNNAFNKMLGKYFLYHVELWWLFLDVSGEKLDVFLHIYQYLGYLGFTFQAAIISDMMCLATFHSYCIYVYAARLFNLQISGLTALLRLFVGRKYNPLRGGIDSCEYTNQEMFVGTVAFTILLLLLPTTLMYYIVFTMFRVLSLSVQYILAKVIYLIQSLPIHVFILWITRSPKIAGNILIEEVESDSSIILKVRLCNKSLGDLTENFTPPVKVPKHFDWSNIVSNVFTGKQII
ncbi:phosphatidylinositol N-acetylglucosaminyltransferase subunit Q [Maniola hyperantus]|uniref:phosphatidylinositol N-acetylglucosaminyltransferase subunit Q n=1 Tax=Aphantopus hyperantus TaxID=2795564 RepID=UPI00156864EE|nr:phosphatidylinositol N-acetylglucosaminyltransferase subunit Q [Maniola hyperantus]